MIIRLLLALAFAGTLAEQTFIQMSDQRCPIRNRRNFKGFEETFKSLETAHGFGSGLG